MKRLNWCNVLLSAAAILLAGTMGVARADIRHVSSFGGLCNDSNDGTSWPKCYKTLQKALDAAREPSSTVTEIWVMTGTYRPDEGSACGTRACSFDLVKGVGIYGGFWYGDSIRATCVGGPSDGEACLIPADCNPPAGGSCVDVRDFGYCVAGDNAGQPCSLHSDCPGSSCKNLTILSGDLGGNDADPPDFATYADNSYHVVSVGALGYENRDTKLDGFTITGGNASSGEGGGIFFGRGFAGIWNCAIRKNRADAGGGGIYAGNVFDADLVNCLIRDNWSDAHGGGMGCKYDVKVQIFNCQIVDNRAGDYGGGIALDSIEGNWTTNIVNTLVARNSIPTGMGAGIRIKEGGAGTPIVNISNCTIAYNEAEGSAQSGGLAVSGYPIVNIDNTIIWANEGGPGAQIRVATDEGTQVFVDHSNVQQLSSGTEDIFDEGEDDGIVFQGEGNLGTVTGDDPLFVDYAAFDYSLDVGSPSIDAGSNALVFDDLVDLDGDGNTTEPVPFDLHSTLRFVDYPVARDCDVDVDMGAYEFQAVPDCNGNGIVDECDISYCGCEGDNQSEDCDDSGTPDDDLCEPGPQDIAIIESNPEFDHSFWRSKNNIIRMTFACDITAPGAEEVQIVPLVGDPPGTFGDDLSPDFSFDVEPPGNILRIKDTSPGGVLVHRTWYAIQNVGWSGVDNFDNDYLLQVGDASDNNFVTAFDLGRINDNLGPTFGVDDSRFDIDGNLFVTNQDLNIANDHLSGLVLKPDGH